jgi:indolepyruvate ferredoxin oxidoreductase beta subunit
MEPLESLRYLRYLAVDGAVITSTEPMANIPDYPDLDALLAQIRALPRARLIDGDGLARAAGSARATNMVMVGAASRFLPVKVETLEYFIRTTFAAKGEKVVTTNIEAFRAGREATA